MFDDEDEDGGSVRRSASVKSFSGRSEKSASSEKRVCCEAPLGGEKEKIECHCNLDQEKQAEPEEEEEAEPYVYPDGGYGWVVVLCCMTLCALTNGWGMSYGVFQEVRTLA